MINYAIDFAAAAIWGMVFLIMMLAMLICVAFLLGVLKNTFSGLQVPPPSQPQPNTYEYHRRD